MVIKTLVIDDEPAYAEDISLSIRGFLSTVNVEYELEVIDGNDAFDEGMDYIKLHQDKIDLIFTDYNLDKYLKGTDLLAEIDRKKYSIYAILHSVTTKAKHITEKSGPILHNSFCASKEQDAVEEELKKYETNVLKNKLFGHEKFRKLYLAENYILKPAVLNITYDRVPVTEILWMETDGVGGSKLTFSTRENVNKLKTATGSINGLVRDCIFFKRVSQSMAINLLWIAKLDIVKCEVWFMLPGNIKYKKSYAPSDMFYTEVLPLLDDIKSLIPFFSE